MASLSLEHSNELKEIVLHYLQGEDLSVVKVRLQAKCAEHNKSSESLYKSIRMTDDPYIQAILGSLNIKPHKYPPKCGAYEKLLKKSNNLHDLLIHLYHDGHSHIGNLLYLIANTKPRTNWAMIFTFGTLASAGGGSLLYLFREKVETAGYWLVGKFPSLLKWLVKPSSLLRFMPFIGIVQNSISLIWSFYKTFANGTFTTTEKLHKLFFKTLSLSFTILAYVLSYVAAGVMTYPIAILFVLGASVDVFQGVFNFRRSQSALHNLKIPTKQGSWGDRAEYERAKSSHQHALKTVWIKISAAILITTAVAVWNFFPPNLVLTLVCMVFISLVGLAKRSILSNFAEKTANDLQSKLRHIEASMEPALRMANNKTLIKLEQRKRVLDAKERELELREKFLDEREEILGIYSSATRTTTTAPLNDDGEAQEIDDTHSANDDGYPPYEESKGMRP